MPKIEAILLGAAEFEETISKQLRPYDRDDERSRAAAGPCDYYLTVIPPKQLALHPLRNTAPETRLLRNQRGGFDHVLYACRSSDVVLDAVYAFRDGWVHGHRFLRRGDKHAELFGLSSPEPTAASSRVIKTDANGCTRLWNAAVRGDVRSLKKYLDAGDDANVGDESRLTPLGAALARGRLSTAKLLIERGADVNLLDVNDRSPLLEAVHQATRRDGSRFVPVVQLLLAHGADPDQPNAWKVTPRDIAEDDSDVLSLFGRKSKGKRSRARRAPTAAESSGVPMMGFWSEHARLWEKLVPPSGTARSVQGEIIRITGKLTREAFTNGNANWDGECTRMWRFVGKTLDDPETFSKRDREEIKGWIQEIIEDRNFPDLSPGTSVYYLVTEKAVFWVQANPKLVPYVTRGKRTR